MFIETFVVLQIWITSDGSQHVMIKGSLLCMHKRTPHTTYKGIIHLVRMHDWRGGGAKAYTMRTRLRGVHKSKYAHKNVPFCMYFVIFSCTRYFHHTFLLSLVSTFIAIL